MNFINPHSLIHVLCCWSFIAELESCDAFTVAISKSFTHIWLFKTLTICYHFIAPIKLQKNFTMTEFLYPHLTVNIPSNLASLYFTFIYDVYTKAFTLII